MLQTLPSHQHQQPITSPNSRLLSRGNDLLAQSSTETLLEMLKSHAGIKECSDETVLHINGVCILVDITQKTTKRKERKKESHSQLVRSVLANLFFLFALSLSRCRHFVSMPSDFVPSSISLADLTFLLTQFLFFLLSGTAEDRKSIAHQHFVL